MTSTPPNGHRAAPSGASPSSHRRRRPLRIPLAVLAGVVASTTAFALLADADTTRPTASGPDVLQRGFADAAREFHVPQSVLLALSYQQTRWESHGGEPSTTGNYNVMGLTQVDPAAVAKAIASGPGPEADGRGDDAPVRTDPPAVEVKDSPALHTLDKAAKLLGRPAGQLRSDPAQSIRGAAALLAKYQKDAGRQASDDPAAWYEAVARFSESTDAEGGQAFADRVFDTVKVGAVRTTADGQLVTLAAAPSVPAGSATALTPRSSADGQGLAPVPAPAPTGAKPPTKGSTKAPTASPSTTPSRATSSPASRGTAVSRSTLGTAPALDAGSVECPPGLGCDARPAAYQLTNPADPSSFGNYSVADRPGDGDTIQYIVIHDTEGGFDGSIATFQRPATQASAHYIVRSSDGHVSQLVATKDVAWHAGNKTVNMHSIGIEHEGFAFPTTQPTWYSEQLYQSSATLTRYLAERFGVPLDRQHIIGHDDVPGPTQDRISGMHWDPGTFWDWNHYMDLLGAPVRGNTGGPLLVGGKVTIAPAFDASNTPPVDQSATRPQNFVYLRTQPAADAALVNGGTTQAADVRAKAVAGSSFVVADQQGDWTAIWYSSQKAWFFNPNGRSGAADNRTGQTVLTPRQGLASVPVYGRTYPELAKYPAAIDTTNLAPISYTSISVPAGQSYLALGPDPVRGDYYYAQNINGDAPADRTLVVGDETYYPIRYNHRLAYLKASDVQTRTAVTPPASGYTPAGPARLLDTRDGTGGHAGKVGVGQSIALQIAGADLGGGRTVPADVTAVVLNVTATDPTGNSFVAVYPDGQPRSSASNLNFTPGRTIPNLVVVPVINGKVDLYNNDGTVHLIADITGYYSPNGTSKLVTAGPARLLDTRDGTGGTTGKVGAGQSIPLKIAGADLGDGRKVPADVTAVVLNVTATDPTGNSFVAVYPDGQKRTAASNLNFTPGQTIPNLVVVPVTNGTVDLYNNDGAVHLIADISSYYTTGGGASFVSAGPTRLLDTRDGTGAPVGKLQGGQSLALQVTGRAGLPANVTAVVLNVTATDPTGNSFVAVYPDGRQRTAASNLNFTPGQTIPNLVVVPVTNGKVDLYNNDGAVHLIADVAGYYTAG
ncbi:N-acetylmuramoyl-L-alanine amidase [Kitasatospora sp. NPDC049258]|uniref:N-acetylmuramoyl-L-alanine amidase n=1 Tax=Kitasatospora sp. NPDC049258 TaxID=3155394 RepID=UPI0034448C24